MPEVSVDNTTVTVVLSSGEDFTPANGRVIVGRVQASRGGRAKITENSTATSGIASGEDTKVTSEISVVLTDQTTVIAKGGKNAYISGFVV